MLQFLCKIYFFKLFKALVFVIIDSLCNRLLFFLPIMLPFSTLLQIPFSHQSTVAQFSSEYVSLPFLFQGFFLGLRFKASLLCSHALYKFKFGFRKTLKKQQAPEILQHLSVLRHSQSRPVVQGRDFCLSSTLCLKTFLIICCFPYEKKKILCFISINP